MKALPSVECRSVVPNTELPSSSAGEMSGSPLQQALVDDSSPFSTAGAILHQNMKTSFKWLESDGHQNALSYRESSGKISCKFPSAIAQ